MQNISKSVKVGDRILKIGEAMNTYHIALFEIKKRNYSISSTYCEEDGNMSWIAKKNSIYIEAFNPLSLLALVVIAETYGENWNKVAPTNFYDRFIEDL